MAYTIEGTELHNIDLQPNTLADEVIRNVSIIVSTVLGECPGWRAFGTRNDFLDRNILAARPLIIKAVISAVETWEPRARIIDPVELYWDDAHSRLIPKLKIEVKEDE